MSTSLADTRDMIALRRHYEIERELADRLRCAQPDVRQALYRNVYAELFARIPDHPQNRWRETPQHQVARSIEQLPMVGPFLTPDSVYLEIGAGDCFLTRTVARRVKLAYGVDVADLVHPTENRPNNFNLLLTDGTSIPLGDEKVTIAFSNMLIEHLHPDDFIRHLNEVYRVLAPGGVYVCRSPHRFSGPQDISQYFDREAKGFHLKEYTFRELSARFKATGFESIGVRPRVKKRTVPIPPKAMVFVEAAVEMLPYLIRKRLCRSRFLRPLFGSVTIVGRKKKRLSDSN